MILEGQVPVPAKEFEKKGGETQKSLSHRGHEDGLSFLVEIPFQIIYWNGIEWPLNYPELKCHHGEIVYLTIPLDSDHHKKYSGIEHNNVYSYL